MTPLILATIGDTIGYRGDTGDVYLNRNSFAPGEVAVAENSAAEATAGPLVVAMEAATPPGSTGESAVVHGSSPDGSRSDTRKNFRGKHGTKFFELIHELGTSRYQFFDVSRTSLGQDLPGNVRQMH